MVDEIKQGCLITKIGDLQADYREMSQVTCFTLHTSLFGHLAYLSSILHFLLKHRSATQTWMVRGVFRTQSCFTAQPTITCSKLTIEAVEQGVKCVQS